MKQFFSIALFLIFSIQNSFSQDFVNKIMQMSDPGFAPLRLEYLENSENLDEENVTTLYFKYIPTDDNSFSLNGGYYYKMRILDNETGDTYDMIDGKGLPTSEKNGFILFHNKGGEIGFSLDFEQIPSTTTDISILWGDKEFISDITIDSERDDNTIGFRFNYLFKSLAFYKTVPYKVTLIADGFSQFTEMNSHYKDGYEPSGFGSGGTVTLIFSGRFDKEIEFKAYPPYEVKVYWQFTLTPQSANDDFIVLSEENSKKRKR